MAWQNKLEELITTLERERDELRVKVHLASLDAKDEFAELERRLDALRARLSERGGEARETANDVGDVVGETARKMADELREGYRKIREKMAE
jgi:predicted  nucleic acid-binding Zn-ribbon protein